MFRCLLLVRAFLDEYAMSLTHSLQRSADLNGVAIVCHGVRVDKSLLEGAGNGLFAGRAFTQGALVTEYDGDIIGWKEANKMASKSHRWSLNKGVCSLCLCLPCVFLTIIRPFSFFSFLLSVGSKTCDCTTEACRWRLFYE